LDETREVFYKKIFCKKPKGIDNKIINCKKGELIKKI
jgi:hypothetical protein